MTMLKIAIVGSGPSGCYVAERLVRQGKGAVEVDVFDRLPTPFGLIRGGVAPDHQGTKGVVRVLSRALERDEVRFFGHVEIGRDLRLADLRAMYDAVVLATGAPEDRRLGITGENLAGVVGSWSFVGWYNGHPDHAALDVALDRVRSAVVIGHGNVAIDVARVLARAGVEMDRSDIGPEVEAAMAAAPLERILIAGRRGPAEVSFTPAELAELGRLQRARPVVDADEIAAAGDCDHPCLAVLAEFSARPAADVPVTVELGFRLKPEAFVDDGEGRVAAVRFRRTRRQDGDFVDTDETVDIPAELVVTCIGYGSVACDGLAPASGRFANDEGRIDDGLYVTGWAKRGPSGTIPTNRPESHALADRILAEVAPAGKPGRTAVYGALDGVSIVDIDAWKRIDAAETGQASEGRVRRKLTRIDDLLAAALN
jgi:NADPH-dependent glutamate synthase beta subunit-like oxidoreductase